MTCHIHIQGQVQGVGFRPFVFMLAQKYNLKGWVNNTTDGVHIEIEADEVLTQKFYHELIDNAPQLSRITKHSIVKIDPKNFNDFQIIHSEISECSNLLLTPDFAICHECKTELHHDANRRNGYSFITCTNCGPRYSIITKLPYDRGHTAMHTFEMCTTCQKEYQNPHDRRYYSQTNSCPKCRIEMILLDHNRVKISNNQSDILDKIVSYWQEGKIIAIKGIGGYLLTCDASNSKVIMELRRRKHRPNKPFAVMFPDNFDIEESFEIRESEEMALSSPVAPIVLLPMPNEAVNFIAKNEIAPHLHQLGVMLPYTPLYDLLLDKFAKPIVATSGNMSNSSIIYDDQRALDELSTIADYIVINNREIVLPQDDSVLKFSFFQNKKIIIRRSRGLAPTFIHADLQFSNKSILATGAMMKSSFSLLHQRNCYISQYLGDLDNFDTQEHYKYTVQHFLNLFNVRPEIILVDKHPSYPSTDFGAHLSSKINASFHSIQHHTAHFGAILGEHNLIHSEVPVLGVIWDGTGWGSDSQIWGGEFFKYEEYDFQRCYYFDYFASILGDKMAKEPRLSALSAGWDVLGADQILRKKFTEIEWKVYSKLLEKENPIQTSSVGRLFDAVASLLGIMDIQTYEGEAAMQLESLALEYFKTHGLDFQESYFMEGAHYYRVPTKTLMTHIVMDLQKGKSMDFVAAKFHYSLVKIIKIVAQNLKIKKIAFSGGVFQNALLVDLIDYHLQSDYQLFFHQQLSPNDENISFGQIMCYQINQLKKSFFQHKILEDVPSDSR